MQCTGQQCVLLVAVLLVLKVCCQTSCHLQAAQHGLSRALGSRLLMWCRFECVFFRIHHRWASHRKACSSCTCHTRTPWSRPRSSSAASARQQHAPPSGTSVLQRHRLSSRVLGLAAASVLQPTRCQQQIVLPAACSACRAVGGATCRSCWVLHATPREGGLWINVVLLDCGHAPHA